MTKQGVSQSVYQKNGVDFMKTAEAIIAILLSSDKKGFGAVIGRIFN